jgi:hypothetical protein
MSIDAILAELKRMYRADLEETRLEVTHLKDSDIQRWSTNLSVPRSILYDNIALHLAYDFHNSKLPFVFCDTIVNDIHAVITVANDDRPSLFWDVFLAFDSGEFYPDNGRDKDPAETYTRPLIAQIIKRYGRP